MRLTSRDYILVLWCLAHVLHLMVFGLMLHVLYVLIESMDTYRSMSMDGDIESTSTSYTRSMVFTSRHYMA